MLKWVIFDDEKQILEEENTISQEFIAPRESNDF